MKKTPSPITRDSSDLITLRVLAIKSCIPTKVLKGLIAAGKIPVIRISETVALFDWPAVKSALAKFETQEIGN